MLEATPRTLPEYEDDSLGHKYMTLWNIERRENASFEQLTVNQALMKGRVDFEWNFRDKSKIGYMYYLEIIAGGSRQALLFKEMVGKNATDGLLNYINQGHPFKLNSVGNSHWMEFDGTKAPNVGHSGSAWTNTGIIEIGVYYVDRNNWETIKVNPAGETSLHITIDADDFRDIEVCAITKDKHIGNHRFRRDFPVVRPVDYIQSTMIGSNRLHMKLHNDTDFVVDLITSGDAKIEQLYWKHVE